MWLAKQKQLLLPPPPAQHPLHFRLLFPSSFPRLLFTSAIRLLSSASTAAVRRNPPPPQPQAANFMVDYLVTSCGLSSVEAAKASGHLSHLKSLDKPEAVLRLLKREGLCVAQIRRVVLAYPRLLAAKPEKTLEPKIRALRGAGFSGSELTQLISTCPSVLQLRNVLPRTVFWRELLGNNQNFLKAASRFPMILGIRLNEKVVPKLSLLRSVGIPGDKIGTFIMRYPRLIGLNIDRIKVAAEQLKSMGFIPGSGAFAQGLSNIVNSRRSTIDAKFNLLRSFGLWQVDVIAAFRGFPNIVTISEKKIRAVMGFLLNEKGFHPLYVARRPVFLGYSLEKRLMPRSYVLQFLRAKGLPGGIDDLYIAMTISEKKFVEKYIAPNSEKFPEIVEIYHAVGAKTTSN